MKNINIAKWHSQKVAQFTGLEIEHSDTLTVKYEKIDGDWNIKGQRSIDILGTWRPKDKAIRIDKDKIKLAAEDLKNTAAELANINVTDILEDMVLIHEWAHAYDDLGQTKNAWFDSSYISKERDRLVISDDDRNEFAACNIETRVINRFSHEMPELQRVLDAWDKCMSVPNKYKGISSF